MESANHRNDWPSSHMGWSSLAADIAAAAASCDGCPIEGLRCPKEARAKSMDKPSRKPAGSGRSTSADYQLVGPMPARMYEVILPKKLGYFGKVQQVLEDLFDERAIRAVPFIQKSIERRRKQTGAFDEEAWIKTLCQSSRGYSIYEMDGPLICSRRRARSTSGCSSFGSFFTTPANRPTHAPISWPLRWRSSTTWWPTAWPKNWASRRGNLVPPELSPAAARHLAQGCCGSHGGEFR